MLCSWHAYVKKPASYFLLPLKAPFQRSVAHEIRKVRVQVCTSQIHLSQDNNHSRFYTRHVRWTIAVALAFLRQTCGDLVPSLNKSRSDEIIAFYTVVLGLAWIAVALRFFARKVAAAKLGMDDWLILIALVRNHQLLVSVPSFLISFAPDPLPFSFVSFSEDSLFARHINESDRAFTRS